MTRRALLAALFLVLGTLPAAAQESTLQFEFENLVPGHPSQATQTFTVDRDVTVEEFSWTTRGGLLEDATLTVEFCSATCVDADASRDTIFPAGAIEVTATATLDDDAEQAGAGSATAVIVLVIPEPVEGDLPFTGADLAVTMAWAIALMSVGWLILVIARRREEEPE